MIWVRAIICLSALRQWLRRKSKNVKGGKTCRSEIQRRSSSAQLTTELTIMSLVTPNTRSLAGELSKTKFLHHVSEAPRTLSEMSQNPAALTNNRVAHSARTLERRSQSRITTSWDGSVANLYSPQGEVAVFVGQTMQFVPIPKFQTQAQIALVKAKPKARRLMIEPPSDPPSG